MGRPTDNEQIRRFLEELTAQGGSAGNYKMMAQLCWKEDEYWRIRDKLVEAGEIVRGRGKGGSVSLIEPEEETDDEPPPEVTAHVTWPAKESDLYEPCVEVLRNHWAAERGLQDAHVEITAFQGKKVTGGDWTRPDLVAVSMRTFKHWPGRFFDIWTFEIKPSWQIGVTGIFEAAAHSRCATHSFAMFHMPDEDDQESDLTSRMVSEAQRMGVGLVLFSNPRDFATWNFKVDPRRREPDPALIETFISQLSDDAKESLIRWGK